MKKYSNKNNTYLRQDKGFLTGLDIKMIRDDFEILQSNKVQDYYNDENNYNRIVDGREIRVNSVSKKMVSVRETLSEFSEFLNNISQEIEQTDKIELTQKQTDAFRDFFRVTGIIRDDFAKAKRTALQSPDKVDAKTTDKIISIGNAAKNLSKTVNSILFDKLGLGDYIQR